MTAIDSSLAEKKKAGFLMSEFEDKKLSTAETEIPEKRDYE